MKLLFKTLFSCLIFSFLFIAPLNAGEKTIVYSWPSNAGPLNPHIYSPNQMYAQAMVYEPLVKYGKGGKIYPCLAQSWEISKSGRFYTFHLRKNVVFSDGTALNAKAIKMNIDAVMANAKRHGWLELVNQIKKTVVVNEHTVKIELKKPYYPLLYDFALVRPFRFLSPSGFPKNGNTAKGIKKAIGTGPWVLTESKLGEYDIFKRNDKYWGKLPDIEKIIVKVLPDPNSRAVAFETGAVDLIYGNGQISLDTYNRFKRNPDYKTFISNPLASRSIALNSNRGATKELLVRKAIQHAVNKKAIIKGVFLNTEIKADTLYSSSTPYCSFKLNPYKYSIEKAKALLNKAGWKIKGDSAFRTKNGKILSLDLCFVGNDAVMKSIAEVIQAYLAKAGIKVVLKGEENDSFYKRQHHGNFDMIFNDSWGPPYDPHSYLSSWRKPSHADFQAQKGLPMKKKIDEKIGKVLVSTDVAKRQRMYRDILTTIHEQAVYLPISYMTGLVVHKKNLKGVSYGYTKYEVPFELMKLK